MLCDIQHVFKFGISRRGSILTHLNASLDSAPNIAADALSVTRVLQEVDDRNVTISN